MPAHSRREAEVLSPEVCAPLRPVPLLLPARPAAFSISLELAAVWAPVGGCVEQRLCHSKISPAALSPAATALLGDAALCAGCDPHQPPWSGEPSLPLAAPGLRAEFEGAGAWAEWALLPIPLLPPLQIFGDYYHFRHHGVVKRSLSPHQPWHSRLAREPQVGVVGYRGLSWPLFAPGQFMLPYEPAWP